MKTFVICMALAGMVLSASAQFAPVQVTVQPLSRKKTAQGDVSTSGRTTYYSPNTVASSMGLRITVQNTTTAPIEDVIVRWGISKVRVSAAAHGADVVYGKDEKCSLKPKETKVFETEIIEASSSESQLTDRRSGEKIHGRGVQILVGGRVVWEEFVPTTVKAAFANIRPPSSQEQEEKPVKSGKPKKN